MKEKIKTQKGFAPIIIVLILAIVATGSIGGYVYFKNQQSKLIGGEKDSHGCLIAAGYSWCEAKQKCLRTWEEQCEETTTTTTIQIFSTTTSNTTTPTTTTTIKILPPTNITVPPTTIPIAAPSTVSAEEQLQILSVSVDSKSYSAILEWDTNQEAECKIYLSGGGFNSLPLLSEMGIGYHHVVHISNLAPSVTYTYKMIAKSDIKSDLRVEKTGEFKTFSSSPPNEFVPKLIKVYYALSSEDGLCYYYYTIKIVSSADIPYSSLRVGIGDKEYVTDSEGLVSYKTLNILNCGDKLSIRIYPNPLDSGWYAKNLYINKCTITTPTTTTTTTTTTILHCSSGWKCKDVHYRGYQNTDCSWEILTYCPGGCILDGECFSGYYNPVGA